MPNRLTRGPTGSTPGNLVGAQNEYKRGARERPLFATFSEQPSSWVWPWRPECASSPWGQSLRGQSLQHELHLASAQQRAAQRDLVCVLEVASDGQAAGEARHPHAAAQPVGEVG